MPIYVLTKGNEGQNPVKPNRSRNRPKKPLPFKRFWRECCTDHAH